jgi:arylsulfatase A-like enzyme
MRGEALQPKPAFSMWFRHNRSRGHQITKGTIAVWEGDYKMIHYLQEGKSLLFNLKNDPEEMDNLIDRETEIGKHLLDLIKTNLQKANQRISSQS